MDNSAQSKVKIRFKFKSGEEFEAEGSPEFIEKQRTDFLQLIGQEHPLRPRAHQPMAPEQGPLSSSFPTTEQTTPLPNTPPFNTEEPAFYRRHAGSDPSSVQQLSSASAYTPANPAAFASTGAEPAPTISQGISAAERAAWRAKHTPEGGISSSSKISSATPEENTLPEIRLWEDIVRVEDQLVLLRRKNRLLTAQTAAVVLLAAARVLLRQADGYSALALSKSLKKSGYGGRERLDRVLGAELKQGTVLCLGSKRARLYLLSDEGFAKAYVLAEKLKEQIF